jgi:DNA-binding CsgD family transcriptional regulator
VHTSVLEPRGVGGTGVTSLLVGWGDGTSTRKTLRADLRYRQAEALLDQGGSRDQAAPILRASCATASGLGAGPLQAGIEALARRARIGLEPGTAAAPGEELGLTPREREVLTLVADGRSKRQIAEELFISHKTASVHVSNILAKLGVANRAEAAVAAHRLGLTHEGTT